MSSKENQQSIYLKLQHPNWVITSSWKLQKRKRIWINSKIIVGLRKVDNKKETKEKSYHVFEIQMWPLVEMKKKSKS